MKEVHVGLRHVALIDDEIYDIVSDRKWSLIDDMTSSTCYAVRRNKRYESRTVSMHRFIMGESNPKIYIDHANGNGLDNQVCNLRRCTPQQNRWNSRKASGYSSAYKGVCWNKKQKSWFATISRDGQTYLNENFNTEIEAAIAYNGAAKLVHGQFARLNVIPESELQKLLESR